MIWPSEVMYMAKRRGPSTEPWDEVVARWCAAEVGPSQDTLNDRPVRYDSNRVCCACDAHAREYGQKDTVVDSVKCSR